MVFIIPFSAPQRGRTVQRAALRGPTRAEPLNRPPRRDADDQRRGSRWSPGLGGTTLRRGRPEALAPQGRQPDPARYNKAALQGAALLTKLGGERRNESERMSLAASERPRWRAHISRGAAGCPRWNGERETSARARESRFPGLLERENCMSEKFAPCPGGERARRSFNVAKPAVIVVYG
jgi:hypothetical protein